MNKSFSSLAESSELNAPAFDGKMPFDGKMAFEANLAQPGDYFALLKPRVMSLVIFTAFVGMMLAPGTIHPVLAFVALLCIALGAGAAGCLNMWYEADIDARMERTRRRPIPAGRVSRGEALGFGATLAVGSILAMGLMINVTAAALLTLTIAFYVFIYTIWLKRRTPQNIVIGGAAGAFPPMIGWAAVTGNIGVESLLLFGIIFMWTPPHFWALSLYMSDDYKRVGIPMLPVVAGERETRRQILIYSILLVPLSLAPFVLGYTGLVYAVGASVLGAVFLFRAVQVWFDAGMKRARQLFLYSIFYLLFLFVLMLADHFFRILA
jgi:protoheme IX farnesyltransferase